MKGWMDYEREKWDWEHISNRWKWVSGMQEVLEEGDARGGGGTLDIDGWRIGRRGAVCGPGACGRGGRKSSSQSWKRPGGVPASARYHVCLKWFCLTRRVWNPADVFEQILVVGHVPLWNFPLDHLPISVCCMGRELISLSSGSPKENIFSLRRNTKAISHFSTMENLIYFWLGIWKKCAGEWRPVSIHSECLSSKTLVVMVKKTEIKLNKPVLSCNNLTKNQSTENWSAPFLKWSIRSIV